MKKAPVSTEISAETQLAAVRAEIRRYYPNIALTNVDHGARNCEDVGAQQ